MQQFQGHFIVREGGGQGAGQGGGQGEGPGGGQGEGHRGGNPAWILKTGRKRTCTTEKERFPWITISSCRSFGAFSWIQEDLVQKGRGQGGAGGGHGIRAT